MTTDEIPELPETPIVRPERASSNASDSAALLNKAQEGLELTDRLMQLQMQRIETLIRLYDQEKKVALQVLDETKEVMQAALAVINGLDPALEKLGQVTAALVQVVQILQQENQ